MKFSPGFGHLSNTHDYRKRAPDTFESRICLAGDGVIWLTLSKLHTTASAALRYAELVRNYYLKRKAEKEGTNEFNEGTERSTP